MMEGSRGAGRSCAELPHGFDLHSIQRGLGHLLGFLAIEIWGDRGGLHMRLLSNLLRRFIAMCRRT
jgi:hypothetical protein